MMNSISNILTERKQRYGDFVEYAILAQALKQVVRDHIYERRAPGDKLPPDFIIEALEQILGKIARIANGDYSYQDSWQDIAGYAECALRILRQGSQERDAEELL